MPLKTEAIDEPSLNLTPMIDIVFLLIIFFMVGAQFTDPEREFGIELPSVAETRALTTQPDPAVVNVTADGATLLADEPVTMEVLETRLRAMKSNFPGQAVLVRGDGKTDYQAVMDVLAACKRSGIGAVSLANRVRQED